LYIVIAIKIGRALQTYTVAVISSAPTLTRPRNYEMP